MRKPATASQPIPPVKPASPGRPKDLNKRAAILDAAKRMFIHVGYERVSMDQIAAEAGVSKLTVYSHFGDKDTLFTEAAKAYCEQQLPSSLFEPSPQTPLRERLLQIGHAFYAMVMSSEAIAAHRILSTPQMAESSLPRLFWESGPKRVQQAFAEMLGRRTATGELTIADAARASSQFFALLKGDPHAQLVFGCCEVCKSSKEVEAHITASVDMFLRAYASR